MVRAHYRSSPRSLGIGFILFFCLCSGVAKNNYILDENVRIMLASNHSKRSDLMKNEEQERIKEILCVQCGSTGLKRIIVNRKNIEVSALQCNNCNAILYEHETMVRLSEA